MKRITQIKKLIMLGMLMLATYVFAGCGTTKVDLNKYVTISSDGYDSMGTVTYEFDYDAFIRDNSDAIKIKTKGNSELASAVFNERKTGSELLLECCVESELDKSSNLSNGDVVTLKWKCDDEKAKQFFNCELKYSDIQYKVSNLTAVKKVDPFKDVEVKYSGIAPDAEASWAQSKGNEDYMEGTWFEIENGKHLKNGDVITVKVKSHSTSAQLIEKYGVEFEQTEKEYTVEGLDYYVSKLEDIPEDMFNKMKAQAEDAFHSYVADSWSKPENLQSVTFKGNYLLWLKEGMSGYDNILFYVFEVKAINPDPEEEVTFYFYVRYTDIMILADGTCSVDLSDYKKPKASGFDSEYFEVGKYRYAGFDTLESLFNDHVTSNIESYEYESTVQ